MLKAKPRRAKDVGAMRPISDVQQEVEYSLSGISNASVMQIAIARVGMSVCICEAGRDVASDCAVPSNDLDASTIGVCIMLDSSSTMIGAFRL